MNAYLIVERISGNRCNTMTKYVVFADAIEEAIDRVKATAKYQHLNWYGWLINPSEITTVCYVDDND